VAARIIRRATTGDVEPLAAYIAQANTEPERQCLHTPGSRRRIIREALWRGQGLAGDGEFVFVVAVSPDAAGSGEMTGALGCQLDSNGEIGWLWGPWGSPEAVWTDLLPELVRALPARLRRLDAFLNVANSAGLRFLRQNGFGIRSPTHIYVAPADAALVAEGSYRELAARHEIGFARLHRETFPASESTSAEELLAGRNHERVIFAAADDLRLLGYVCVSVNVAPREGFVDYLAVRPAARGRGIGQRLLQTALHWAFATHGLPQVALCVTEWRDDARRLYERAGFRLAATGRGARRQLR
jgi:GNAT superfamily N-acetyltransferase